MHEHLLVLHLLIVKQVTLTLVVFLETVDVSKSFTLLVITCMAHNLVQSCVFIVLVIGHKERLSIRVTQIHVVNRLAQILLLLDHSSDALLHPLILRECERLEHEPETYLRLLDQQLRLHELNQTLVHIREGIEDERVERQTAALLPKRAALHFLVRVLEHVEGGLHSERVEEGLVAHVNPVDYIGEVLHGLPVQLEEGEL